tara:strand:- start:2005 stop:2385 length:381 start_codon:yes stop_codon:yes gene_type:complete
MASNIRFIDDLKVGAYTVSGGAGGSTVIDNNFNNYVLTATGNDNIKGNTLLQFDGVNLGIGGPSNGARFEINDITGRDLVLIKNSSNQGIKVNSEGIFQLIKFNSLPSTAPEGGLAISANNFYVGL